jgi:hypothetical protein
MFFLLFVISHETNETNRMYKVIPFNAELKLG